MFSISIFEDIYESRRQWLVIGTIICSLDRTDRVFKNIKSLLNLLFSIIFEALSPGTDTEG